MARWPSDMAVAARFLPFVIAPALLLSGCAPDLDMRGTGPTRQVSACAQSGGFLDARGRRQSVMCVHPYSDAGKACSSRADCQGKCIAERAPDGGLPATGLAAAGRCQADDKLFGCYAEVDNGKVRSSICVD